MITIILHLCGWFLLWIVCGSIAYARTLVFFRDLYPHATEAEARANRRVALVTGLAGYIGLGMAIGFSREFRKRLTK